MLSADLAADSLSLIEMALAEDLGAANLQLGLDATTAALVPRDAVATANLVSRDTGIVSGLDVCRFIIKHFAPQLSFDVAIADGKPVSAQQTIATLRGSAQQILTIERTCLNFLGRLSGISTLTQRYVALVAGTKAEVFDTRKTTPGWRRLEKWAVACGGGKNHRLGLNDAVMIKDNHLAFFQSQVDQPSQLIPRAVQQVRNWIDSHHQQLPHGRRTVVQLEVDTIAQLEIALSTACDIILLDNMDLATLRESVLLRDQRAPQILLEASGGVNLNTVRSIAETGVERISVGALTHSATNFDIGLDWVTG